MVSLKLHSRHRSANDDMIRVWGMAGWIEADIQEWTLEWNVADYMLKMEGGEEKVEVDGRCQSRNSQILHLL